MIKILQVLHLNALVIIQFCIASQRMQGSEQRTVQLLSGQDIHSLVVHQKLLAVDVTDNPELLFRECSFLYHLGYNRHGLVKVLSQRVQRNKATIDRRRKVQPSTVIIQSFGYFARSHPHSSFTQHAVGKHRLKRLRLVKLSAPHQQVETNHVFIACRKHIQRHTVTHAVQLRLKNREMLQLTNGRGHTTVELRHRASP